MRCDRRCETGFAAVNARIEAMNLNIEELRKLMIRLLRRDARQHRRRIVVAVVVAFLSVITAHS